MPDGKSSGRATEKGGSLDPSPPAGCGEEPGMAPVKHGYRQANALAETCGGCFVIGDVGWADIAAAQAEYEATVQFRRAEHSSTAQHSPQGND